MNKLLLSIILFCASHCFGQNQDFVDSLMKLGKNQLIDGEYIPSISNYRIVWNEIKNTPPSKQKITVQNNLGVAYWKVGDYINGVNSNQNSLNVALKMNNDTLINQTRYNLGLSLKSLGNNEFAVEQFLLAIEGFESINDHKKIALVYDALGNIHTEMKQYKDAESYHFAALKKYKELGDLKGESRVYINLAHGKLNSQNIDDGYAYLRKALTLKTKLGVSLAKTHSRIGEYYLLKNELDSAEFYINLSLSERKLKNNRPDLATAYWRLGQLNIKQNKYDIALENLTKAHQIADSAEANALLRDIIISEVEIQTKKKDYPRLAVLQERLILLNEIVLGEKSRKELARFDVKYGSLQKDQELIRKNNELEIGKIQKEKLTTTILVLSLFAMIILFFVLFLIRLNRKLKQKQVELINKNVVIENLHKELDHRTRNYFEMFSGMIRVDRRNASSDETSKVLEKYNHRVEAMSQISNHLNMVDTLLTDEVHLDKYLQELLGNIDLVMNNQTNQVEITYSFDTIHCDYNRAIRLGLVMNELLNNAFEHGLVNHDNPKIGLNLKSDDSRICLLIEDNGVGIQNESKNKTGSQGLTLMEMVLSNINGVLSYPNSNGNGTIAQVLIPHKKKGA